METDKLNMKHDKITNALNSYYAACEVLRKIFEKKYFSDPDNDEYTPDSWWVADIVGGALYINGYFFSMREIVTVLKLNLSSEKLFELIDDAEKNGRSLYHSLLD